ncbi:negative regulation of thymidylate synthase biosynthetic process [Homalodisca vitripennis]|nr:negative regulation of thymidylate synthase biosynthetic process [Homalodisca vitripennis]
MPPPGGLIQSAGAVDGHPDDILYNCQSVTGYKPQSRLYPFSWLVPSKNSGCHHFTFQEVRLTQPGDSFITSATLVPPQSCYHGQGDVLVGSSAVLDNSVNVNLNRSGRPLDLTATLHLSKPDLIETTEHNNVFEKTSAIPHVPGQLNNDLYAVPVKRRSPPSSPAKAAPAPPSPCDQDLPAGWERHEDNDGPYYWHIKSGTIQRDPPECDGSGKHEPRTPLVKEAETVLNSYQQSGVVSLVTRSNTSSALEDLDTRKKEELAFKRRSYPARAEPECKERPIRFAVRSLGWVEIAEEDLTPERSSKAVNKCIVDLSLGRNDLIDNVGRWGDGKDLFMDLDEGALKLIDPENLTTLNTQPIHTIRVWGVGRDNGRLSTLWYMSLHMKYESGRCNMDMAVFSIPVFLVEDLGHRLKKWCDMLFGLNTIVALRALNSAVQGLSADSLQQYTEPDLQIQELVVALNSAVQGLSADSLQQYTEPDLQIQELWCDMLFGLNTIVALRALNSAVQGLSADSLQQYTEPDLQIHELVV